MSTKIINRLIGVMLVTVLSILSTACSDDDNEIYGTCEISGTVTNTDGQPIEGAKIQVAAVEVVCLPAEAVTDKDGHYRMTMTEATSSLVVMVEAPGYYNYNEVINGIPFTGAVPDVTLGKASITIDVVMAAKQN